MSQTNILMKVMSQTKELYDSNRYMSPTKEPKYSNKDMSQTKKPNDFNKRHVSDQGAQKY